MTDGELKWEQSPTKARRSISFVSAAVGAVLALVIGFALGGLLNGDSLPRPKPDGSPPTIAAPSESAVAPVPSDWPSTVTVPLVEGLTVAEARRVLHSVRLRPFLDDFEAKARPGSRVVGQAPAEGSPAPKGSRVGLRTDAYEEHSVATACGRATIAAREYGDVIVGAEVEVRTADAGQFIVMDTSEPVSDLRVQVRRLRGPGRLRFETFQGSSRKVTREVTLGAGQHRLAEGWPPHWGVGAHVTGPGCWHLRITGGDAVERLVFEISDSDWKRFWRKR